MLFGILVTASLLLLSIDSFLPPTISTAPLLALSHLQVSGIKLHIRDEISRSVYPSEIVFFILIEWFIELWDFFGWKLKKCHFFSFASLERQFDSATGTMKFYFGNDEGILECKIDDDERNEIRDEVFFAWNSNMTKVLESPESFVLFHPE